MYTKSVYVPKSRVESQSTSKGTLAPAHYCTKVPIRVLWLRLRRTIVGENPPGGAPACEAFGPQSYLFYLLLACGVLAEVESRKQHHADNTVNSRDLREDAFKHDLSQTEHEQQPDELQRERERALVQEQSSHHKGGGESDG